MLIKFDSVWSYIICITEMESSIIGIVYLFRYEVDRQAKVNWECGEGLGHFPLEDLWISNMASWRSKRWWSNLPHRVLHQTREVYNELICTQTHTAWCDRFKQVGFVLETYWNHKKERIWSKSANIKDIQNLSKQQLYCQFDTSNRYKSVN